VALSTDFDSLSKQKLKETIPMDAMLASDLDNWASNPTVQQEARAFLCSHIEDGEKLVANLEGPFFGSRMMNFKVIEAMNQLYWQCREELMQASLLSRADFNTLAMRPDPEWRKVLPLFAFALGFRSQDGSTPTGTPKLLRSVGN
jgi:hypothetical protein